MQHTHTHTLSRHWLVTGPIQKQLFAVGNKIGAALFNGTTDLRVRMTGSTFWGKTLVNGTEQVIPSGTQQQGRRDMTEKGMYRKG